MPQVMTKVTLNKQGQYFCQGPLHSRFATSPHARAMTHGLTVAGQQAVLSHSLARGLLLVI